MAAPQMPADRVEDAAQFVRDQIAAMPAHLRVGVEVGGAVLALHTWARTRHAFSALPKDAQRTLVAGWLGSRLPPVGQYVRVLRSLALYAAWEPST